MDRSRKICIISHCLLNCNSKVESPCKYKACLKELIYALIENDYGIIQLPCPETTYYGMRRWGHVKEQFNNPYFRKHCEKILEPIIMQIKDYKDNGYEIPYVIGVNGSPSCGIDITCSSSKWKGEISKLQSINCLGESLKYKKEAGVFMEIFMQMLQKEKIDIKFLGVFENKIEEYNFNKIFK